METKLGPSILSPQERSSLQGSLREEDIKGLERQIKRNLGYRQQNWSTLKSIGKTTTSIVLVGLDGVGKSSVGNLLTGKEAFRPSLGAGSGTTECTISQTTFQGRAYTVIDTPACVTWEQLAKTIKHAPTELRDGIHVFVLVMNASGFRTREQELERLKVFNDANKHRWMVVTTHSNMSYAHGSADKFIEDVSTIPDIRMFMEKIEGRVVLVDCGSGKIRPETALDGNATCDQENKLGQTMVFDMIHKITQGRGVDPREEILRASEKPQKGSGMKGFFRL